MLKKGCELTKVVDEILKEAKVNEEPSLNDKRLLISDE
jgi:hypothetical protein